MTETPQVVSSYLHELDSALRGMPAAERQEIVGGVREELTGLDATAASARIEELGDPVFIAAQAREAAGDPAPSGRESFGYAVAASLLVALGGLIVPVLGWIVGLGMVWFGRTWRVWEKVVATFAPLAVGLLAIGVSAIATAASSGPGESANPLLPAALDFAHASFLLVPLGYIVTGLWLLARARRSLRPRA